MPFVIGVHQTPFRRGGEWTHAELVARAVNGALLDSGLEPDAVEGFWFGSTALHKFTSPSLGGTTVLQGVLPAGAPVVQVEAGGATGGYTLFGAFTALAAGQADLVVAVGVDLSMFDDPVDLVDRTVIRGGTFAATQAEAVGDGGYTPDPDRSVLLDVMALEARYAIRTGAVTRADLAAVVAKSRDAGIRNPDAWLRSAVTADEVLAEPKTVDPFTRSMTCALVDGAAAVVLASDLGLARLSSRARAVRIGSMALGSGTWRALGERPGMARVAGRAYARAATSPDRVDLAEVHDMNAYAELKWIDALGLSPLAEAAALTRAGETAIGGRRPVNVSGGLLSKGHGMAATGIGQVVELVTQLRGEAGPRQVRNARTAIAHNGGGMIGFDDAACVVTVLQHS